MVNPTPPQGRTLLTGHKKNTDCFFSYLLFFFLSSLCISHLDISALVSRWSIFNICTARILCRPPAQGLKDQKARHGGTAGGSVWGGLPSRSPALVWPLRCPAHPCTAFPTAAGNDIGDEGARYVAEALKVNSTVQQLNFRCTPLPPPPWIWMVRPSLILCTVPIHPATPGSNSTHVRDLDRSPPQGLIPFGLDSFLTCAIWINVTQPNGLYFCRGLGGEGRWFFFFA